MRKFDVPLRIKNGIIGRLSLKVPITQIRSQPWVLNLNDIYLLLESSTSMYDVEFVEKYNEKMKEWLMDAIELQHKV